MAASRRRHAVVVSHPDDEALWLSSALANAERVVFCFGAPFARSRLASARRSAVAALPIADLVDLAVPESGARFNVDWARPRLTPSGIAITNIAARDRYRANYRALLDALRPYLVGLDAVYTHNPWGEYGHAEHIQVHRAVVALQAELGYTIWFSNYVGGRSWPLARQLGPQLLWAHRRRQPPNFEMAGKLMQTYRQYAAWTWNRTHRWPDRETLYALPSDAGSRARWPLSGEWLLDVAGLRWWPPPWRPALRQLR